MERVTRIKKGGIVEVWETTDREIPFMEDSDVLQIPESSLPLAVLSSSAANPFAFGIINFRKSIYNHFMWMHKPGYLATQDWCYQEVPLSKYMQFDNRLKFWHNPKWTVDERKQLINKIQYYLDLPKYKTFYDFLAILGQAVNQVWIQNPLFRICSDYGSILKESGVDVTYDLKHPAPDQVDEWFQNNSNYEVFGRYAGE